MRRVADVFLVHASPERLEAIRLLVHQIIRVRRCTKAMASSLRGRQVHLAATRPGKTGRAYLAALSDLADHGGPTWSEQLQRELKYVRRDLDRKFTKTYPLTKSISIGPRIWTDASFEPRPLDQGGPKMRLCAIVANSSARAGVVSDVPIEFYKNPSSPRNTNNYR